MSKAAKITLGTVTVLSCFCVWGVHYLHDKERADKHAGVIRDESRVAERRKRLLENQRQLALRQEYERIQPVTKKNADSANT